jgi:hypothetical protein
LAYEGIGLGPNTVGIAYAISVGYADGLEIHKKIQIFEKNQFFIFFIF